MAVAKRPAIFVSLTLAVTVKTLALSVNPVEESWLIRFLTTPSIRNDHHATLSDLLLITFRSSRYRLERRFVFLNTNLTNKEAAMKALIICSVHALCNISELERRACNRACKLHGIPAFLTYQDHAPLLEKTTMLDALGQLASKDERRAFVDSYLGFLNDEVWSEPIQAYQSVFDALLDRHGYARPTGFVSDYPVLTTNLIRASALLTNATKLGVLTTLSDPLQVQSIATGLAATATSLNVAHHDVDVLVANQRDFVAAQSIGMHPRFVEELRLDASCRIVHHSRNAFVPAKGKINCNDLYAFAVPA